jgi:hypothetical protein
MLMRWRLVAAISAITLLCMLGVSGAAASASAPLGARLSGSSSAPALLGAVGHGQDGISCAGGSGPLEHVIYVQFDNTHLLRDLGSVPSDLEQMPHLLNFMRKNGTVSSNDHTILISHTAGGILSSLSGVYPDRHGQAVSNSFRYYKPDGSTGLGVSFAYWTDGIFDPANPTPPDTSYNMLTKEGKNAPAPWAPFTRAGCDFGAVGAANTVLENIGPDVPKVFGPDSPEAEEAKNEPFKAMADFVGITVHCAKGSAACAASNRAVPDLLPDEPGGYEGFDGLFGAKYVNPVINPNGPLTDLDGNVITDPVGNPGFPGFDGMSANRSLSWVAAMQEHGIPITFAYISDAHDLHPPNPSNDGYDHIAQGPGEVGYVQQLRDYDRAFAKFFDRLQKDGITPKNTLFVFTADEGDHFAGGKPANPGCDGVNTPCEWAHVICDQGCPPNDIGEINVNLRGLLATQRANTTPFDVHSDMAPAFYLIGNPERDAAVTRTFERDVAALTAVNPYTGETELMSEQMVDRVGMSLLHMATGDPLRTPTLVSFLRPDYFGFKGASNCSSPCVQVQPAFAWNHGGTSEDIATTWVGFVGPSVRHLGTNAKVWVDHTDVRPTILTLAGLKDDYQTDGRVLIEFAHDKALPKSLRAHQETLRRLGEVYKQVTAPFGRIGVAGIEASTKALEGDDATYQRLENALLALTSDRDALAARMLDMLQAAAFDGKPINEKQAKRLIKDGKELIERAEELAES